MAKSDSLGRADIQAVSRASQILGLFNVHRSELVTTEVADELGLNRTTAHRYLTSMAAVGLLEHRRRNSSYVVGPQATKLGAIATGSAAVLGVAPRLMLALSEELAATVALSLWASTGPMVAHIAEPRTPEAVLTLRVGTVLSIETAQGTLFAAFLREPSSHLAEQRDRLDPVARKKFDKEVEQARESGLVVARRPESGAIVVAAPVFDQNGLCATVAVVGLAGSASEAAIPERSQRIRELAAELTARLGGSQPT